MSSTLFKIIVAALAATAVQALPSSYPGYMNSTAPPAPPAVDNSPLIAELKDAPTALARFQKLFTENGALLTGDALRSKIVFDFGATAKAGVSNAGVVATGGKTSAANIGTFPVLTDLGISTTVGFLNACGINTPHNHPRATEFLTLTEGSELQFGIIVENGLVKTGGQEIAGSLSKYQGTVFPMGSIHYQFNPTCDPATFIATLNSEDPGTNQATNFFALNDDVVRATLGAPMALDGQDLESFRKAIPTNLAQDIEVCLSRCGMAKR